MPNPRCQHCGLPLIGRRSVGLYCCHGCALVARLIGPQENSLRAWTLFRLALGSFLSMDVMMLALLLYSGGVEANLIALLHWVMLGLATPAMALLSYPFLLGATREIRRGRLSLDSLIAIGSIAAYAVSAANTVRGDGHVYFDTATMLPALVTFGRLIEASAKTQTGKLVHALETLLPATARVVSSAGERETKLAELRAGDVLRVRPGERIPADGTIIQGSTIIDDAAFTGEAMPRSRQVGDALIAGTVNGHGPLLMQAQRVGSEMLLSRIIAQVEEAQGNRSSSERLADRLASGFTPAVLALSAGAGAVHLLSGSPARAGLSALAVLVVACPCALGIATPLATSLAIARAAKRGVLVRGGDVLERIGLIRRLYLDKTGTLTTAQPTVAAIESYEVTASAGERAVPPVTATPANCGQAATPGCHASTSFGEACPEACELPQPRAAVPPTASQPDAVISQFVGRAGLPAFPQSGCHAPASFGEACDELLCCLASLEQASQHPLAKAAVQAAAAKSLTLWELCAAEPIPGGLRGRIARNGQVRDIVVGSPSAVRQSECHASTSFGEACSESGERPQPRAAVPRIASQPDAAVPPTEGIDSVGPAGLPALALTTQPALAGDGVEIAWDGRLRGRVLFAEQLRPAARAAIEELRALGVEPVMLSGDATPAARSVASSLGIGDVRAAATPQDKISLLNSTGHAGMVGDGINDAPALAIAEVGIAMGGGTDLARQAGNVVLLSDRLEDIPWLIALSRRCRRIVLENLLWAGGYNALALAAAATGVLHPLLAACAMFLSSLSVLANSMRLATRDA